MAHAFRCLNRLTFIFSPNEAQHHLSIASLMGVLNRANQRKKFTREDKSTERSERKAGDGQDMSRSNSVQSTNASSFALAQQMSALNAQGQGSSEVKQTTFPIRKSKRE